MSENLSNKEENSNLKQKAISGTLWTAIQKFGISIVSFLSSIVLARLLTPSDYGCIGMLSIFIALSYSLISGGFVSALIQKKDADEKDFNTVFYWNLAVSAILYWFLYFSAPSIGEFYHMEKLSVVLRVQGVILVLNGLCAIQTTIFRKRIQFRELAKANIISSIAAVIVAIVMAYYGFGVWALVGQQIVTSTVSCILLWVQSSWRPKFLFSTTSFKNLFSYGSYLLFSEMINTLCDNIQGLIIGKKFNASMMGYYSQAKRLEEVPTTSITQVVNQVTFPIYASIQNDKERLGGVVRRTLGLMNFVNIPLMILLIAVAKPLFIFLFSDKWLGSVLYFQILCMAGVVNCLQSVNYQVVAAVGRSKDLFYWNFVKRGVGILFMIIGLYWKVEGLLVGMVLSTYFTYVVNACMAGKSTGYTLRIQLLDILPMLILSVLAGFTSLIMQVFIENHFLLLLSQSAIFIGVYLLGSYLLKSNNLTEIIAIIKNYTK